MTRRETESRVSPVVRMATVALACAWAAGCASAGRRPAERAWAHAAGYVVSCSVANECRVQYIDEEGVLRARDVTGEWKLDLGADSGTRLWLRASAGGCPPRPLRVEIWLDGVEVSERLERATHASRCDWLLAETEFGVP